MSPGALQKVRDFKAKYPLAKSSRVLEVGSADVNGSVRAEFAKCARYVGCDIKAGAGVDVLLDPEMPLRVQVRGPFDCILCLDVLEHILRPWVTVSEMAYLLAPGGLLFILVPFAWPLHQHPLDCWRFAPDGLRDVAESAGLTVLESWLYEERDRPALTDLVGWLKWLHSRARYTRMFRTGFIQVYFVAKKGTE